MRVPVGCDNDVVVDDENGEHADACRLEFPLPPAAGAGHCGSGWLFQRELTGRPSKSVLAGIRGLKSRNQQSANTNND